MHERLLDKNNPPGAELIREWIGPEGAALLLKLEAFLSSHYQLSKELRFPFGNQYGWGYKYGHKTSHLCYAFFEAGSFTVTLQLGDACVPAMERVLPGLSPKARELWQNRYPCGERGGWIHYRVIDANDLSDVLELIKIKKKPAGQ